MPNQIIDRSKDLCYTCRYQINTLVFIKDDKQLKFNADQIISLEILNDYEFNIRSIIKLAIRVDIRQKLFIIKNKRDIKAKVELDTVGQDLDSENIILGPEKVFNHEFSIYLNDDDEAMDAQSLENSIRANEGDEFKITDIENQSYYESDNVFYVYLFEPKLLNASNKRINRVFTKATMQDIVGEILTESNHKKVIMSRIQNDEVYQELLVPSNPAYKALVYLDQYYGFYKRGAIIFYDVDTLYIINPNGKVTAKEDKEWPETTFLVTTYSQTSPGHGMVRKGKEKVFYINVPEDNISPSKPSLANSMTCGSEAKIVITDDITIDVAEADQSYMDQRNEFITYGKKDDTKFAKTILQARMEENEAVIYITGRNMDINAFKPNKTYKLIFMEQTKQKKYGKYRYRIAYAYHLIQAESQEYMASSHGIVLKRCSKIDE